MGNVCQKKIFSIEFFKLMPPIDLNLMYSKVVELKELYHYSQEHF